MDGVAPSWSGPLRGEVVWLYAYDLAYDLLGDPLSFGSLLGAPIESVAVERSKRHPLRLPLLREARVRLPDLAIDTTLGRLVAAVTVKILPIGAIAIAVRAPFVATLDDLIPLHEPRAAGASLDEHVRGLAERALAELRPRCVRPVASVGTEEPYTVFCLEPPALADQPGFDAQAWLAAERPRIAALLTQEPRVGLLSAQEVDESTERALSYYRHDLAVVDWDAALIIDDPSMFDQMLWVLELANVQLTELEAFDRLLEAASERAYGDLRLRAGRAPVLRHIAGLRIDLARLADELRNIGKLYGDWHLARVHQAVGERFHLVAWQREIADRLKILDELYQILKQDRTNRWMLTLEIMVVLLFVADLVLLIIGRR